MLLDDYDIENTINLKNRKSQIETLFNDNKNAINFINKNIADLLRRYTIVCGEYLNNLYDPINGELASHNYNIIKDLILGLFYS